MLSKSSPLKLLGQMKPNLAGSIYVRSSINFLCFVPFGQQIWLPRAILWNSLAKLNQTWQEASTVFSCIFHAGFFTFFFSQIGGARYTTELIVHIFFLTEFDCLFMGKWCFCLANQYCLSDFLTTQCPKKHCNECLWIQICLLIISPSSDLCHIFIIVSSSNTASHRWTIYLVCKHIVRCTCQSGKYSLTLTSFSQSCDLQHILKLLSFE
jgi:hypothetical protein